MSTFRHLTPPAPKTNAEWRDRCHNLFRRAFDHDSRSFLPIASANKRQLWHVTLKMQRCLELAEEMRRLEAEADAANPEWHAGHPSVKAIYYMNPEHPIYAAWLAAYRERDAIWCRKLVEV